MLNRLCAPGIWVILVLVTLYSWFVLSPRSLEVLQHTESVCLHPVDCPHLRAKMWESCDRHMLELNGRLPDIPTPRRES